MDIEPKTKAIAPNPPSTSKKEKGKEFEALTKKKYAPPTKPKGIVIGSPIVPTVPMPQLEEGGQFLAMMIITLSTVTPGKSRLRGKVSPGSKSIGGHSFGRKSG